MNLQEKIIKYQTEKTPRADYLAHYYWGNQCWSKIGVLIALVILIICKMFFFINLWFLPLALLPYITAKLAAQSKEKRDSTGLGNEDENDIKYTIKPSIFDVVWLTILIVLMSI